METGKNRLKTRDNKGLHKWLDWLNNSVAFTMFMHGKSAQLQLLSFINFINFTDIIQLLLLKLYLEIQNNMLQILKCYLSLIILGTA